MLYLSKGFKSMLSWHVGESVEDLHEAAENDRVAFIQADGDELARINASMSLPRTSNRNIVIWYGDDARFIAANL